MYKMYALKKKGKAYDPTSLEQAVRTYEQKMGAMPKYVFLNERTIIVSNISVLYNNRVPVGLAYLGPVSIIEEDLLEGLI